MARRNSINGIELTVKINNVSVETRGMKEIFLKFYIGQFSLPGMFIIREFPPRLTHIQYSDEAYYKLFVYVARTEFTSS